MITQTRLKEVVEYNPVTGNFTWIKQISNCAVIGRSAGSLDKYSGYIRLRIDGIQYRRSRLAWLYVNGVFPTHEVDHADRDKTNDSYSNLREATESQNKCNRVSRNRTGIKGLQKLAYGYLATVTVKGKRYSRTMQFSKYSESTIVEELSNWLENTRINLHGDFCNNNSGSSRGL